MYLQLHWVESLFHLEWDKSIVNWRSLRVNTVCCATRESRRPLNKIVAGTNAPEPGGLPSPPLRCLPQSINPAIQPLLNRKLSIGTKYGGKLPWAGPPPARLMCGNPRQQLVLWKQQRHMFSDNGALKNIRPPSIFTTYAK